MIICLMVFPKVFAAGDDLNEGDEKTKRAALAPCFNYKAVSLSSQEESKIPGQSSKKSSKKSDSSEKDLEMNNSFSDDEASARSSVDKDFSEKILIHDPITLQRLVQKVLYLDQKLWWIDMVSSCLAAGCFATSLSLQTVDPSPFSNKELFQTKVAVAVCAFLAPILVAIPKATDLYRTSRHDHYTRKHRGNSEKWSLFLDEEVETAKLKIGNKYNKYYTRTNIILQFLIISGLAGNGVSNLQNFNTILDQHTLSVLSLCAPILAAVCVAAHSYVQGYLDTIDRSHKQIVEQEDVIKNLLKSGMKRVEIIKSQKFSIAKINEVRDNNLNEIVNKLRSIDQKSMSDISDILDLSADIITSKFNSEN